MTENEKKEDSQKKPDPGVFLTKGMQINIPEFSIRISPDGNIDATPLILHTTIDLCPYWLEIAYDHLRCTEDASEQLLNAKKEQNDERIADALKAEFTEGMQTIMASAVAMDAFYANVKERIAIPDDLIQTWRKNGTARYKQIAEVLRRAFLMSEDSAKQIRVILKHNFGFRDKAVHPPTGTTAPTLHSELNKVTDWRYVTFRYYNAKAIAGLTLSIITQTAMHPKNKHEGLKTYCETLSQQLAPLISRWEARYGKLFG